MSRPDRLARRPGRPAGGSDDLRDRLVEQALQAFATHGIAATSLAAVARAAGTSPALVNYYFGGREGLVAAVVDGRLRAPMQTLVAGLREDAGRLPALDRLQRFAHRYVDTVSREPWLPRLIAREVLSEGGSLREAFAERFATVVFGGISEVIAEAQGDGALRQDLAPPELALGLMSLLIFPFLAGPVLATAIEHAPTRDPARLAGTRWTLFLDGARAAPTP